MSEFLNVVLLEVHPAVLKITYSHSSSSSALKTTALDQFEKFVEMFPVTLADEPPTKKMRISAGYKDRNVYDKWRGEQRKMRLNYILGKHLSCI